MMDSDAMPVNTTAVFSAPHECCPRFPKVFFSGATGAHLFTAPQSALFYSALQSHPAVFTQTEALYRIASERSRLKRGPPSRL